MSKRGRPRAFDREAALRKAMRLFWAHGYEGTSMSDLTQAMGISSPSIYAAFGCKEELFREAVKLYGEGTPTSRALREERSARQAVEAMFRDNADAYTDPADPPGCMIVLAAILGSPETKDVRDFLSECRRVSLAELEERLKRGVAEGDLPAGCDTAALAGYCTSVLNGLSILARDMTSRAELHDVVDCAMAAWDGLTKSPRRRRGPVLSARRLRSG